MKRRRAQRVVSTTTSDGWSQSTSTMDEHGIVTTESYSETTGFAESEVYPKRERTARKRGKRK